MPLRICAIDVGTHSVRSLTCDVTEGGRWTAVDRGLKVTALGKDLAQRCIILPEAARRSAATIAEFVRQARDIGADRIIANGTMALRSARNSREIIALMEKDAGISINIIGGEEEAELTYTGVAESLRRDPDEITVFDVGGGSTEVIWRKAGGRTRPVSFDTGCLTLTDRYLASDPPSREEIEGMEEAVSRALAEALPSPEKLPPDLIGAGGTVTTAAAIITGMKEYDGNRVHGTRMSSSQVAEIYRGLAGMPLREREKVEGLMKERAPVIVAGLAVVKGLMEYLRADVVTASDYGILLGVIMKAYGEGAARS